MSSLKTGTIYKIICAITDDVYIGSTFNTLRNRWQRHKGHYNDWINKKTQRRLSIYPYFEKYGIDKFKIIKIKEYECVDKKHLESKEQLWISKSRCVNENNSFRIEKISKKFYQEHHKEQIKETKKKYYDKNKEQIHKKHKLYRDNNKEIIKEKDKEYRKNNKEKIAEKKKETYDCECGSTFRKDDKSRHERTIKHQNYIKN
jgi:hypothetical protein